MFAIDDNKDSDTTNEGDDKKKPDGKPTKKDEKVDEALTKALQEVKETGSKIIATGVSPETIQGIVAKHNDGKPSPSSIKTIETCAAVMKEFNEILAKSTTPPAKDKSTKTETKKENK